VKQFKTRLMPSILIAALLALSASAVADVVAIVNKANTFADKEIVGKLYALKARAWPDGSRPILYELSVDAEREAFYRVYTGKSADTVQTDLAKAVFVGRAQPHKVFNSDADVINEVAKEKDAVGYVNESSVDKSVRIVR
jgi:hypothetical protein